MFKIVDGSANLGIQCESVINTRKKLFNVIKKHFVGIIEGKNDESKLFWATYSVYVVKDDGLYLCSRLSNVSFPIYDVEVEKSDATEINIIPYKLNEIEKYIIDNLKINPEKFEIISPLEVLGWEEDLTQNWKGKIWIRGSFTGWNTIKCSIDKENLKEIYFNFNDFIKQKRTLWTREYFERQILSSFEDDCMVLEFEKMPDNSEFTVEDVLVILKDHIKEKFPHDCDVYLYYDKIYIRWCPDKSQNYVHKTLKIFFLSLIVVAYIGFIMILGEDSICGTRSLM